GGGSRRAFVGGVGSGSVWTMQAARLRALRSARKRAAYPDPRSAHVERLAFERENRAAQAVRAEPLHLQRDVMVARHEADELHAVHSEAPHLVLRFDVRGGRAVLQQTD